ncbi:MAG: ABC transporter ATP-binding protein [Alphaproteobacteria bacterium]|nr:ABC transporter ATP-binding protein [Alphaproteobacteria bacterium]
MKDSGASRPGSAGGRSFSTKELLLRLYRGFVRPHLQTLIIAAGCMGLVAATTAANALIIERVLDDVFVNRDQFALLIVPAAILVIALVKAVATYFQSYLMSVFGQRIIADIQNRLFAHLMRADLSFFHGNATGGLISRFLTDTNLLSEALSKAITGIAKDLVMAAALAGVLFFQDWRLAIVACVIFPIAILPVRKLGRRMRKASTQNQERAGAFSALLAEAFQGARHVKAYGMEAYESDRARAANEARLTALFKVVRTRAASTPLMEFLSGVAIAAVVLYAGNRVFAGEISTGAFFSFLTALLLAYQPVKSLAGLNTALQEGLAAAARVFTLLDTEPDIRDRADAKALVVGGGGIRFDQVVYAYNALAPALHGVSFEVPAGKTLAIVGPSGAGKSTILNLIPRFFDVNGGRVSIDGQDVRAVTQVSLRRAVALVSQESTLFNDTVRANIAYGRPGASEAEIVAAATSAAAHDFIVELPQGYDTMVGEAGVKLSGGQRQRIAIARAMLKNAPVLLLDEATSSLDTQSERQVQDALQRLSRGRTTVVVAHRLSTVVDADRIVVIDGGLVVDTGTHAELMARGGLYAKLYALQATPDPDPARASA